MNPYQEWLNCKSKRPHYFELLGVSPKETDEGRIRRAAASRLATVRQVRPGKHIEQWQALIDEIGLAEKVFWWCAIDEGTVRKKRRAAWCKIRHP